MTKFYLKLVWHLYRFAISDLQLFIHSRKLSESNSASVRDENQISRKINPKTFKIPGIIVFSRSSERRKPDKLHSHSLYKSNESPPWSDRVHRINKTLMKFIAHRCFFIAEDATLPKRIPKSRMQNRAIPLFLHETNVIWQEETFFFSTGLCWIIALFQPPTRTSIYIPSCVSLFRETWENYWSTYIAWRER